MEELLKERRSIRKYKQEPLKKNEIDKILKCGLLAPSSRNSQPWEIYLTKNKEKIIKLSQSKKTGVAFIKAAPLVVVLVANPNKSSVWIEDLSIMATLMQITAWQMGIGSCWVQIRNRNYNKKITSEEYIKNIMDIDSEKKVLCLLSFGYINEDKKAYEDKEILFDRINWS